MKILLAFLLTCSYMYAQTRPKIALVLSGGGARGGAHVGVLKVLEEKKIPIDIIVGTSMGSFVGGLYASGKSAQEIEDMLLSSDWYDYIRTDFNRKDIPIRRKKFDTIYTGRLGLGINAKNELVIPTGVLKREPLLLKFLKETQHVDHVNNFDNLSIPFRAVATNILNGEKVVIKSGRLGEAIYASSAIPGGLQPININGIDLVDGGVSSNLPIEVAQEMGADIIIAVDVSEHFAKELNVDSYFVVMGQLVNILMRKNANKSIDKLGPNDILITPTLHGFSGLDADKYEPIIKAGEDETNKVYASKLSKLSLKYEDYLKYAKTSRVLHVEQSPIIDEIRIVNDTYIGNDSIRKRLHVGVGDKIDNDKIRVDMLHIYNMMIFDSVTHKILKENGKNILVISVTPSWDNHGEIRFSGGLEDDFQGDSDYFAKLGYTMFGLNEYGGEWKTDLEAGRRGRVYTELFQPFDSMQRYYLRPSMLYQYIIDDIPNSKGDDIEHSSERYGPSLGLGAHVTTDYEYEVGISYYKDELKNRVTNESERYTSVPLYASVRLDSLDNLAFPNTGLKAYLRWEKEEDSFGSDYKHEQIYFDITAPVTFGNHNITSYFKYGNTYNNKNEQNTGVLMVNDKFYLGGLFNLSGHPQYSQIGNDMFLGVLKYRYKLKGGGFFGSLNAPLYAGGSVEAGQTYNDGDTVSVSSVKKSMSLYLAADTFLGPLYMAYALTDDKESTFYLYIGEQF